MQSDTTAYYMITHFLPIGIPRATVAVQNKAVTSHLNRDKDNYSSQYGDLKKSSISKIWKIHHLINTAPTMIGYLCLKTQQASNAAKRQAQLGGQSWYYGRQDYRMTWSGSHSTERGSLLHTRPSPILPLLAHLHLESPHVESVPTYCGLTKTLRMVI